MDPVWLYSHAARPQTPSRGNSQRSWQTIARYARCWGPFLDHQLLHYGLGHSLRDLQEAMSQSVGEVLSREACNRLVLGLEERAHAGKMARLEAPHPLWWWMGGG